MNIIDEIAKTSIQLILKEPFYGHFFTGMLKDTSEKTDSITISMDGKQMLKMLVNETYWSELKGENDEATKNLRYGAIKHQILHIIFKHIFRGNEFGHKQLFGIACDIAVNQYIASNQLTADAIRLEDFPDFKLERNQSVDYYYRMLMEELAEMQKQLGGQGDSGEGQGDSGKDQETPENTESTSPQEQSGDGEDGQQEQRQEGAGKEGAGKEGMENLNDSQKKLLGLLTDENSQLKQHDGWQSISSLSTAERKMLEAAVNEQIVDTVQRVKVKNRGTLPAGLSEYLEALLESFKPNVNWRRVLRLFAASSSKTSLKNTIRRPSKRYGTTPGIKIQKKQKILVAIDTSGSVSTEELVEFFGELYHIWKNGAEIFIVECDAAIGNAYYYRGKCPEVVSGRGGTDFNPPFEYAKTEYKPDAIVYFTDGHCTAPENITNTPLLWMVSSKGIDEDSWDYLPGRKVKMTAVK
jgi:predicted metal-dependent peptidase